MAEQTVAVRRSADRFLTEVPGLRSRHSFSFGEHYDPDNVGFGPLLAFNEDLVQIDAGYDDHPHADTEILTWVLSGTLQHVDSAGHRGLVVPGLAQRMSAGSGIVHAERNDGFRADAHLPAEPVHFVQMWLRPDSPGGVPDYAQQEVSLADLRGGWVPVASGSSRDAAVPIGTRDATLWAGVLAPGTVRTLPDAPRLHLFVARGEVEAEQAGPLTAGDAVRLRGSAALRLTARTEAELLVWAFGPVTVSPR